VLTGDSSCPAPLCSPASLYPRTCLALGGSSRCT
jgi:hypothetical protein